MHARLLELNPNYDQDFPLEQPTSPTLDKRAYFPPDVRCDCQGRLAVIPSSGNGETALLRDIQMLRDIKNKILTAPKGPGYYSRVSCSSGAAITWCNDVRDEYHIYAELLSFRVFNKLSPVLTDTVRCRIPRERRWRHLAALLMELSSFGVVARLLGGGSGQVFYPTNWNVIVDKQKF